MCQDCVTGGLISQEDLDQARKDRDLNRLPFIEMTVTEAMDALDEMISDDTRTGVPVEITQAKWMSIEGGYLAEHPDRAKDWEAEMLRRMRARLAAMSPAELAALGPEAKEFLANMN